MSLTLKDDQHELVKKQLHRLEWSGTNGTHCPECGGERPTDKVDREGEPLKDGRLPMKSGVFCPAGHEGHARACALAASILTVSSKDRIVIFCQTGDPQGFEEGRS